MDDACPSGDDLRRWLHGAGDGALERHLLACELCRAEAERLSDDPALRGWADALAAQPLGPIDDEALSKLVDALCAGAPAPAVPEEVAAGPGPGTLGPFEMEAEIGRGGMGVVYRARDRRTGRVVALKVLRPELADDRARRRFEQEARAAARVEHDHVVRLYSTSDPADPVPYLVMEHVAGPSLADELRERPVLSPRAAAEVVAQAAEGLAAAHAAGLVHRDVKPGNILLDAATGRARVGDFGLARVAAEAAALTRDGVVAGTPAYLSPEQARGDAEVGPLADVYALGACLYECLTGGPPFRGTPHAILRQVLEDEPRPPRSLNDAVPRDLETVCLKALAKEPSRRYGSAAEMADDLRRWLAGEPVRARPLGPLGRLWRRARRHPKTAALAVVLGAATLAGAAGVAWQWLRAEANARQARAALRRSIDAADTYFVRTSESRLLDVPGLQPLRRELLEAARDYYESLLRERPDDPGVRAALAAARHRLGVVYNTLGRTDDALAAFARSLAEFDRAIRRSPADAALRRGRLACLASRSFVQLNNSRYDEAHAGYLAALAEAEALRRERPAGPAALEPVRVAEYGLARIALLRGRAAEAIRRFECSRAIAREQGDRLPGDLAPVRSIALVGADLATLLDAQHRPADAAAAFDEGYRAARRLVADGPGSIGNRDTLAVYESARVDRLLAEAAALPAEAARGQYEEAARAADAGLDLLRPVVRDNPQVGAYRGDLVRLLSRAAGAAYHAGRPDRAIEAAREAGRVFGPATAAERSYLPTRLSYISALVPAAAVLAESGRLDEALALLGDGDAALAAVAPADRALPAVRYFGAVLASQRAMVLLDAGRAAESVPHWDAALRLAPAELRPVLEFEAAVARHRAGQGPAPGADRALAARPVADFVLASGALSATELVAYASLYADAAAGAADPATAEALDARAVACLDRARLLGYFRLADRAGRIDADPALDRLRSRADYRAFRDRLGPAPGLSRAGRGPARR